jgi:hypothetical protein
MTPQEIAKRRAELQSMVARGFNDYETALDLLDVIEQQAARIRELEAEVERLPGLYSGPGG